jgi:arylsulfatase A-like enzyme
MVAAMDSAIGRVVATLAEKGLRDNTLIIFSSDNGGPSPGKVTDNGPLRAGKGTLYEGGVRACAFASWPSRIPANQILEEPVHIVDWYPTLIKLAGGTFEQKLPIDGLDLWPVLTSKAKSPHDAVLLCGTRGPLPAGIRMGNWKLLIGGSEADAEEGNNQKQAGQQKLELYNLAEDLGEKNNLVDKHPDKLKELHDRLLLLTRDGVAPGNAKVDGKPMKKKMKD